MKKSSIEYLSRGSDNLKSSWNDYASMIYYDHAWHIRTSGAQWFEVEWFGWAIQLNRPFPLCLARQNREFRFLLPVKLTYCYVLGHWEELDHSERRLLRLWSAIWPHCAFSTHWRQRLKFRPFLYFQDPRVGSGSCRLVRNQAKCIFKASFQAFMNHLLVQG